MVELSKARVDDDGFSVFMATNPSKLGYLDYFPSVTGETRQSGGLFWMK
jgi:hypothetical protein